MVTERIKWHEAYSEWTIDGYIWKFWFLAQAHAIKLRGHLAERMPYLHFSDIQVVATETLIKLAEEWPELSDRQNVDPADVKIFWHMCKLRIGWALSDFLHDPYFAYRALVHEGETGEIEDLALLRTVINNHTPPSALHNEVVDTIAKLNTEQQMLLAFRFYEGMQVVEMGRILAATDNPAGSESYIRKKQRTASERILLAATNRVITRPVKLPPLADNQSQVYLERAANWIRDRYECDTATYLEWVLINYRSDVGLVDDIIRDGHGERIRRNNPNSLGVGAALTAEQVREIRLLLKAGRTAHSLAEAYNVSDHVIGDIRHDRTYRTVA